MSYIDQVDKNIKFFEGRTRLNTLDDLTRSVRHKTELIALVGESGTGKTLFIKKAVRELRSDIFPLILECPLPSFDEMLNAIYDQINYTQPTPSETELDLEGKQRCIMAFLERQASVKRQVTVLIDDAHLMSVDVLSRLLAFAVNREQAGRWFTVVLSGSLALKALLSNPDVLNAIGGNPVTYQLNPLNPEEIKAFIRMRLTRYKFKEKELFLPEVLDKIMGQTQGVLSLVDSLFDSVILFADGNNKITLAGFNEAFDFFSLLVLPSMMKGDATTKNLFYPGNNQPAHNSLVTSLKEKVVQLFSHAKPAVAGSDMNNSRVMDEFAKEDEYLTEAGGIAATEAAYEDEAFEQSLPEENVLVAEDAPVDMPEFEVTVAQSKGDVLAHEVLLEGLDPEPIALEMNAANELAPATAGALVSDPEKQIAQAEALGAQVEEAMAGQVELENDGELQATTSDNNGIAHPTSLADSLEEAIVVPDASLPESSNILASAELEEFEVEKASIAPELLSAFQTKVSIQSADPFSANDLLKTDEESLFHLKALIAEYQDELTEFERQGVDEADVTDKASKLENSVVVDLPLPPVESFLEKPSTAPLQKKAEIRFLRPVNPVNNDANLEILMNRSESLSKVLKQFKEMSPDVEAAALISDDGLMIASVLPDSLDDARVGGMSATLLSLGTRCASVLNRGTVDEIIVRGAQGYSILINAGRGTSLLAVTNAQAKLGLITFDMRDAIQKLAEVL